MEDQQLTTTMDEATTAPQTLPRPRRLRLSASIRRLVRETALTPDDFIYPLFIRHGQDLRLPIESMPGQFQISLDRLPAEAKAIADLGIPAVLLFGIPAHKDACGSDNFDPAGIIPRAIGVIKEAAPDMADCHLRYVLLRIHRSRALRFDKHARQRPLRSQPAARLPAQRPHAGIARPRLGRACPRRRRYHRALRHARWHGRRHPPRP